MSTSTWALNEEDPAKAYNLAAKQSPQLAQAIQGVTNFFSPTGALSVSLKGIQSNIQNVAGSLNGVSTIDNINPDIYRRLRYQYSNLYIATAAGTATTALGGIQSTTITTMSAASLKIQETLKPVSSFMGSTLGNLTGVLKDPLGSVVALPGTLGAMMSETNPMLAAKYEATFKKYNIDKLAELPQSILGSTQQIFKMIDTGLAVPINFITDIYYGAMDVLKQFNDLIDSVFSMIQQMFNTVIRTLAPGLLEFLSALSDFASQLGAICTIFSGVNQFTQFLGQVQSYANLANGFAQNPASYLQTFIPQNVSNVLYTIQNPQNLLNQLVPDEIANGFKTIQSITGFGFNGKMGYGLESVLNGLQGGVISSMLEGFATQFSILSPLLTGRTSTIEPPSDFPNSTMILKIPNGEQYNVDRTTGQVVRIRRPEPVYQPKK